MLGCMGALAQVPSCWMHHLQLLIASCICMQCWATRTGPVAGTTFSVDPGVQHLYDSHSWQLLNEPWVLQTT